MALRLVARRLATLPNHQVARAPAPVSALGQITAVKIKAGDRVQVRSALPLPRLPAHLPPAPAQPPDPGRACAPQVGDPIAEMGTFSISAQVEGVVAKTFLQQGCAAARRPPTPVPRQLRPARLACPAPAI